jgi:hypothetical protein
MTDEFYACNDCGAFNESNYIRYRLETLPELTIEQEQKLNDECNWDIEELKIGREYSDDEIEMIQKALKIDLDIKEISRCSVCDGDGGNHFVCGTGDY